MAIYTFRCIHPGGDDGLLSCAICSHFDLVFPIGSAPVHAQCPVCDGEAVRVFIAPRVSRPSTLSQAAAQTPSARPTAETVPMPRHPNSSARPVTPACNGTP